jgi:hypothetical protein
VGTRGSTPTFKSIVIVWWGIFGSAGAFLIVLATVPRPDALAQPEMLPLLALVAASTCALGAILPGRIFAQALKGQQIDAIEVADPHQAQGFGRVIKVPRQPEQAQRVVLGIYTTKTILGCALGESVSLFGLVLGMLGAPLPMCLPFFVAGGLVQAYHYPRLASMLQQATTALGIRFG